MNRYSSNAPNRGAELTGGFYAERKRSYRGVKKDMGELDKLELYLRYSGIRYKRIDENTDTWGRHQINVFGSDGEIAWDAICHRGSYGYEEGLLEIYGNLVDTEKDGDSVVGWLTAEDVIKRIEEKKMPEIKKQDITIGIGCIICGEVRELTKEETEYNRYFGTIGTIYICDKCKQAIAWAKTQMEP